MLAQLVHLADDIQYGGFERHERLNQRPWFGHQLGGGDLEKLAELLDVRKHDRAVLVEHPRDVGTRDAKELAQRGVRHVFGFDELSQALAHALLQRRLHGWSRREYLIFSPYS